MTPWRQIGTVPILVLCALAGPAGGEGPADARARIEQALGLAGADPRPGLWDRPPLDALAAALAAERPELADRLKNLVDHPALDVDLGQWPADPVLRANLRLYAAREWTRAQRLDEALGLLTGVDPNELVDPASYWFVQMTCTYHLGRLAEAKAALERLSAAPELPRRYRAVADQVRLLLEPLAPENLAGIAHDMRDVRRRLELERADEATKSREADIVARLDRLIKELEERQQGGQGGGQSTAPAPESRPLGAEGEGKVDDKPLADGPAWGNLPPKERERALQDLGREFPAHYRDAVEEYFRKLAAGSGGANP